MTKEIDIKTGYIVHYSCELPTGDVVARRTVVKQGALANRTSDTCRFRRLAASCDAAGGCEARLAYAGRLSRSEPLANPVRS